MFYIEKKYRFEDDKIICRGVMDFILKCFDFYAFIYETMYREADKASIRKLQCINSRVLQGYNFGKINTSIIKSS